MNAVYIPFEAHDLKAFFKRMVHPGTREIDWRIRGLSITAPHKTDVLAELDWIDPGAREIGAVNSVVVEDNLLCGYNTDAGAFVAPLKIGWARSTTRVSRSLARAARRARPCTV